MTQSLQYRTLAGYGGGDFALNLCWQGVGFYLLYYFTDVLGIPASIAGTLILVAGLWDALSDPLMGFLAERTKTRFGHYRPFLIVGAVPLALSFLFLFSLAELYGPNVSVWLAGAALIVFRTCYTVVSIPYSALGARLTDVSADRTRLSGVRMYGGMLGGLTVVYMARLIRSEIADPAAFMLIALISGILILVFLWACFASTSEAAGHRTRGQPARSLGQLLTTLQQNKAFLVLFLAMIGVTVANSFIFKTVLYLFEYDFKDRNAGNNALLIMTIAPLITIPFWSSFALRFGKRLTWRVGCLITAIGCLVLALDISKYLLVAYVTYAVLTLGLTAFAVLLWSMLPDVIDHGEYLTGVRNESVLIGIVSSSQKASIAGSAFCLGLLLEAIGYQADASQTAETLTGLRVIISWIPAAAIMLSALVMVWYPISKESHARAVAAIGGGNQASRGE